MTIEFDQSPVSFSTVIKVIGVGGAGGNAVNTMIERGIDGVEFIVANTDIMDLRKSKAKTKIQIGEKLTKGHGGGADPKIGREAALESREDIITAIKGADMLFISAGLGGGTGTGAAPIIAELARELEILTLGILTKPLKNENTQRMQNFDHGLANLRQYVDSYIVIPNDKIAEIDDGTSIFNLFKKADTIIYDAAKAMSDIINKSGYINVDFADVKSVIANMGYALMGTSVCEGDERAVRAAQEAISNPLLNNVKLCGCKAVLLNITAGDDTPYQDFDTITSIISSETGAETKTIIGLVHDKEMEGKICVTIFASGIVDETAQKIGIPPLVHIKTKETKTPNISDVLQTPSYGTKQSSSFNEVSHNSKNKKEELSIPSFMRRFKDN